MKSGALRHFWLFLIIPASLAVAALMTDYLPFKMGVPIVCAVLLLVYFRGRMSQHRDVMLVIGAFVFSAIGDYFLSNKRGTEMYFVIGIAMFFVAHIGYLGFALWHGRLQRVAILVLLAGYVPYYVVGLRPAINDAILSLSVLLYLLISCLTLAAALGLRLPPTSKWLYVFGIVMIVVSDTFISFNEFLEFRAFNDLILPTYYLAHLAVTLAVSAAKGVSHNSQRRLADPSVA